MRPRQWVSLFAAHIDYPYCSLQGLGHVVGYCGDGMNDVPALQAADAGLSVGAFEAGPAVLTAPVASLSGSVMGTAPWSKHVHHCNCAPLQRHCMLAGHALMLGATAVSCV